MSKRLAYKPPNVAIIKFPILKAYTFHNVGDIPIDDNKISSFLSVSKILPTHDFLINKIIKKAATNIIPERITYPEYIEKPMLSNKVLIFLPKRVNSCTFIPCGPPN